MATDWVGTALLRERMLVYVGAIGATGLHAHHAIQIAVGLNENFRLRDGSGRSGGGRAAVIPCDVRHAIETGTDLALLVFVDADDAAGRRLRRLGSTGDVRSWFAAGARLRQRQETVGKRVEDLGAISAEVIRELAGPLPQPENVHPAVSKLLTELPGRLLDQDVRLPALAKIVGLSPGRLTHVFKECVGIPIRQYILWLRLQVVVANLQLGTSLTNAAHAAGFSDSSHLSNTFRKMFGLAPSEVAGGVRWVTES